MLSTARPVCVCVCACMSACRSSRLNDVSCVTVVCSVGQSEVPAGDYCSLGPLATALHQSLQWEKPATGSQDFYIHDAVHTKIKQKQVNPQKKKKTFKRAESQGHDLGFEHLANNKDVCIW